MASKESIHVFKTIAEDETSNAPQKRSKLSSSAIVFAEQTTEFEVKILSECQLYPEDSETTIGFPGHHNRHSASPFQ